LGQKEKYFSVMRKAAAESGDSIAAFVENYGV
jgi:hypothetical protein